VVRLQNFTSLIVKRFRNINPEKDGKTINIPADVKNEIKIITLPDNIYALWEEFVSKHAEGALIDLVTFKPFRVAKNFNIRNCSLKREFFKHLAYFTDEDLRAYATHLLGKTLGRTLCYPKVSVSKTKILVRDNQMSADWVDRRKRKKIILDELVEIKPSLRFRDDAGNIIDDVWRPWKRRHRFSSATWDFLISETPVPFFTKRLTNEAKNKTAEDLTDKFPELLPMYQRFMEAKYKLRSPGGSVQIQDHDMVALSLTKSTAQKYETRALNLGIMDLRDAPKGKHNPSNPPPLIPFLESMAKHVHPTMTVPNVWLWILGDNWDTKTATDFIACELKDFECMVSAYLPAKAERLNNVSNRNQASQVCLLFLFKKESATADVLKCRMKTEYKTPNDLDYYKDPVRNNEAKWRTCASELRMEFYLEILQSFASAGENVIGIYAGSKCMLAAKVNF